MSKKKMNVLDFKKYKDEGKIFTLVTGYDYTMASIINDSDIDIILVGDSLGNVMLGYDSTVGVTMNDMICYGKSVVKGAPDKFIVVDMPFGSYNVSCEQAVINANRIIAETNCDCVKLEGGVGMADKIGRSRWEAPSCGHPPKFRWYCLAQQSPDCRHRWRQCIFLPAKE